MCEVYVLKVRCKNKHAYDNVKCLNYGKVLKFRLDGTERDGGRATAYRFCEEGKKKQVFCGTITKDLEVWAEGDAAKSCRICYKDGRKTWWALAVGALDASEEVEEKRLKRGWVRKIIWRLTKS